MDKLLLLLMHEMWGLRLEDRDIVGLLRADPNDEYGLLGALQSDPACGYFRFRPNWMNISLRELEAGACAGVRWGRIGDPDYPWLWLKLSRKPLTFSYLGPPIWRQMPMLAVVGSRTPSTETQVWMRRELPAFLRERRIGIVSGAARGVDQWAHRLCMDADRPTICVLPSGVLNPYPPRTEKFWDEVIGEGGCLLSTFPLNASMRKQNFHIRNRWIAGLSPLVFVAESNRRSGSALTGKLALDENRTVATLPVFPHATQGMHNLDLIFAGAHMIRDRYDLASLWEQSLLSPALLERVQGEGEENDIHGP